MRRIFILISVILLVSACKKNDISSGVSADTTGKGGSMARFALLNDYLYTVDDDALNVFSIAANNHPVFLNKVYVGFQIETLFAYENHLYIGSQSGMFIYRVDNPEVPVQEASVAHFTACDPVVTDGNYAYVTLHSGSVCGSSVNALQVYDVSDIQQPVLLQERTMISPKGLGLYHNYLLVCDDEVKIFDVSNPGALQFVKSIPVSGFDVIIIDDHLLVVGEDGLYQYALHAGDMEHIQALSTINY